MTDESKALVIQGEKLPKTPNREIVTRSRAMKTGGSMFVTIHSFMGSLKN
ncbi:MAG: hypothetical protein PHV74_14835 [Dehalococcoidia bacterium]|nr:hypothetical protein [Dehalococcoidia bacterium]